MSKGMGRMLRETREAKGLTQEQIAQKAGVTEAYISMLESGARKNPSLAMLKRLAKILGVPLPELLQ
jgi:transcriptional regulator with XRE-family HTH domain